MKTKTILWVALAVFLVSSLSAFVGMVSAQDRAFTLPWSVISSGGLGGSGDDPFWG